MRKVMSVSVMVDGFKVGTGSVSYDATKVRRPAHTHLMCPGCGKVWGSVLVDAGVGVRHTVSYVECKEHGGGVFSNFAEDAPVFDREILERDFVVMYDWIVNGLGTWQEGEVFTFGMSVGSGKKSLMLPII